MIAATPLVAREVLVHQNAGDLESIRSDIEKSPSDSQGWARFNSFAAIL
jgi:hypothetical protein